MPNYTGHTAWRAVMPASDLPPAFSEPASNLWLGEKAHIVHYPLRAGAIVNIVALVEDDWRGDGERGRDGAQFWDQAGDRRFLLDRFKDWAPEVLELLSAPETWLLRWPLFDRPPLASYARGRTALLGDAAHPMLPYLAQGAAQAIEDFGGAVAGLSRIWRATPSRRSPKIPPPACRAPAKSSSRSRKQGKIYHMAGAPAFARDLVLRLTPSARLMARQNWIIFGLSGAGGWANQRKVVNCALSWSEAPPLRAP